KVNPPATPGGEQMPTATASTTDTAPSSIVGIDDESTSGDESERPKMNAAARSAYERGMAAWAAGDLNGARQGFSEATQADGKAYQAFYSLGVVLERSGDQAAAQSAYQGAITALATYEPAITAYGLSMARRGDLTGADTFLTAKQQDMPKSVAVLAALAEVKSLKRDTGTAQRLAQDALKLRPSYAPAMVVLARDHYRNRRLDLALYALDAIVGKEGAEDANNPPRDRNNPEAHLLRAVIYKEQGRRSLALNAFKKAISLRPDLVDARVQLAAYQLESGNAAEAKPQLDEALKYNKDHLQAHLNRGDALRLLSDVPGAKQEFDWVIAKDPNLPQVHYSLGLLYLFSETMPGVTDKKVQYQSAISELERFQQLRGKVSAGNADDSDQLISRAKNQIESIKAQENAHAAASAAAAAPPAIVARVIRMVVVMVSFG
ncbi:MAG: tetratricopeptide repeat protein, partial [Myxococcales bacterium]